MTRGNKLFQAFNASRTIRALALASATAVGMLTLPAAAPAADRDWSHDRDAKHTDVRVDIELGRPAHHYEDRTTRVWVEPVYRTVGDRVWIAPVYNTVSDRVWVAPVTEDRCEQTWIPDRYEVRDITHREGHHTWITRESILVDRGHFEDRHTQVIVRDGHWEDVQRQVLVSEGHWQDAQQECIAPGHWETRVERVAVSDDCGPTTHFFDFVARFGHR